MADENDAGLPSGVSRIHEWRDECETFEGEESALIAAGMVRPEWLAKWTGQTRQIVPGANGEFRVVHEGKGNGLKDRHRDAGAVSVKRLKNDLIQFTRWRTTKDRQERERIREEEYERRAEAEAWEKAKKARAEENDFVGRWRASIAHEIAQLRALVKGQSRYQGFPDIKLAAPDLARVEAAIAELQREFAESCPFVADIETKSNVISLRANAHSAMKASH